MQPNPVLKKLGYSATDRLVIIHADDLGMCQASIAAAVELFDFGLISSGAVMVPCPWFLEAAEYARDHLDEEGFFHHRADQAQAQADPMAAQRELQAQMEQALAAGLHPTHADTHMGTVAHPKFMQGYIQLALQYGVPPMMLRLDADGWREVTRDHVGAVLDEAAIAVAVQMVHQLEEMGVPLLDRIASLTLDVEPGEAPGWRIDQALKALELLPPGVTHFIIHPSKDTPELRAITPDWPCRVADYQAFLSPKLNEKIRQMGVQVIGYRALKELMPAG
jgi:predicted glycoside hydrolase/deacetylase ChbG (UPF0249 family)